MPERTLTELLYGKGAHAGTLACLEDVSFDLASRRASEFPHSIWQIVYHMNYWMTYELERIAHKHPAYPAHAAESWPAGAAPSTDEEWQETVVRFRDLLAELDRLAESPAGVLAVEVEALHPDHKRRSYSLLDVLWQTLVHNSYHIGQVAMLRRALGAWPPKDGGDSW